MTYDDLIELAAKASYEAYFDGLIGSAEMPWKNLHLRDDGYKERFLHAMEAAIRAIESAGLRIFDKGTLWSQIRFALDCREDDMRRVTEATKYEEVSIILDGMARKLAAGVFDAAPTYSEE